MPPAFLFLNVRSAGGFQRFEKEFDPLAAGMASTASIEPFPEGFGFPRRL
jgi:hypothetical protein